MEQPKQPEHLEIPEVTRVVRWRRRFVMFFACAVVTLGPVPVVAQPVLDPRDEARLLAERGYALFEQGELDQALAHFAKADATFHAPSIALMIARTQQRRGKLGTALAVYDGILSEQLDADAPPAFAEAQATARSERDALEPQVPKIVLRIDGPRADERVKVTVDARAVESFVLGEAVYVDPGPHQVQIRVDGGVPHQIDVLVAQGQTETIDFTVPAPLSAAPDRAERPPKRDEGGDLMVPAIVAFGVSGAGLVMGIVTGVVARSKEDELEQSCPSRWCFPEDEALADSAELNATLSTVGFIIAGIGAAAGGTLMVLEHTLGSDTEARLSVTPGAFRARVAF